MIADHTKLVKEENERHKAELAAIDRFCLFLDEFEKTGTINGLPYLLNGISFDNKVARFKPIGEGREYFFDANKEHTNEVPY